MKDQNQIAGDNATNIQAGGAVTINQGLSYADARQIALDVFTGNFMQLAGEAADIARRRAEEITEEFLRKLQNQNPNGITQSKEPDFQHALFTIQKEYARCNDMELGNLLVDLLVDRTKHPSRSILQIVLNESLSVAPKLTADQLAALSIVFYFRYTIHNGTGNLYALLSAIDRYAIPFIDKLESKESCYQHLEYSGCGTIGIGKVDLGNIFRTNYSGFFSKGFDEKTFQSNKLEIPITHPIFRPCVNNSENFQTNALNEKAIELEAQKLGIEKDLKKIINLHNKTLMSSAEIKDLIIEKRPQMEKLFDAWEKTLGRFTLTSVGIAIGHANIKKAAGEFTDLSIWIN